MIAAAFLYFIAITGVFSSYHRTQPGCTTTTTCQPDALSSPIPRPGKRGPVGPEGPKGSKGEPHEGDGNRISMLQNEIDELKAFKDLAAVYLLFPNSCAEYIAKETENLRFDRVPIYPGIVDGRSLMMMANCRKLPELINPTSSISLEIPKNSLFGRTLVFKAIPRDNRFSVNFKSSRNSPRNYFHIVADMAGQYIARNDYVTDWNTEEKELRIPFPLKHGVVFTYEISVDDVGFHVKLDGNELLTFRHRQRPYGNIHYITAGGGLTITYVSFN